MYRRFGKRLLDLVITLPALVVLSPLLAILALLVRVKLGAPILFRQMRPGLHGRPFTIYKFRTMTDVRDAEQHYSRAVCVPQLVAVVQGVLAGAA